MKQNYPDTVAFYDSRPGNEVGLFYNGPEHHTGHEVIEPRDVNSHVSRTPQARSHDQVTPLQLYTIAPPLQAVRL